MKTAIITLESVSPYSQSRQHDTPKKEKERFDEYESRTWREKSHFDDKGMCYIPADAFNFAIKAAAKRLSIQIPGKGKSTYTKNFLSGILCDTNLPLGVTKDEVVGVTINANADGIRGTGKRVKRTFPRFPKWAGEINVFVFDDAIPKDIFEYVIAECGKFIGVGQYRAENGGTNGRFIVKKIEWK